jgi:hypothetical protein
VRLANASHWVMRDEPERISTLLAEFFVEPAPAVSEPPEPAAG